MATIWLGNHQAIDAEGQPLDGKRCTVVQPAEGLTIPELIHDLTHEQGVWAAHSTTPAPAWVASDDGDLAQAISAVYGCPIREPEA